jgi:hypothetical protein
VFLLYSPVRCRNKGTLTLPDKLLFNLSFLVFESIETMKIASVPLLVLFSLVDRADSQFVCDFCPNGGIQNPNGVVVILTLPDKTCTELEADAKAFNIGEGQCPALTAYADPVCCVAAAPTTSSPTNSPTLSPPTTSPTGTPTAAPSDSTAPSSSSQPTVTPTGAPTFPPAPDCYTDLDEILRRERAVYDSTVFREYILCPDTYFLAAGSGEGSGPILPRRNTAYKCGVDGKSSNNCIITKGHIHLISADVYWDPSQYEIHSNVTISGITFESGNFGTVVLQNPGDITFVDCIFRVSAVAVVGALEISK